MKRKVIIGMVGLASVFALGLASCSKNYEVGKLDYKELESVKDVVKDHFDGMSITIEKDSEDSFSMSKYTPIDSTKYTKYGNAISGYSLYYNENGYIGIYSNAYGKFLVSPRYKKELINGISSIDATVATIIEINYGGKYDYFDTYGNEIIKDSQYQYTFSHLYSGVDYSSYVKYTNNETKEEKYLLYKTSDNGKATKVDEMPKDEFEKDYKAGDLYNDYYLKTKVKEDVYTIHSYNGAQNTYLDVYDKDNKLVKKVEMPYGVNNVKWFTFNNGNMLIQYSIQLTREAQDYNYSNNNNNKYQLVSLKTNLFDDSKVTTIDLPYVIVDNSEVANKEKELAYQQVELKMILSDRTLGPSRYYLMNEEYKLFNELPYKIRNLIETKNGYYDSSTYVLYNSDLEILTYLDANSKGAYKKNIDSFVFSVNNLYGVVSSTGKVTVPFEYKSISSDYNVGTKVFATNKDNVPGILDVSNNTFTELKEYEYHAACYTKYDAKTNKTTFIGLGGSDTKTGTFEVDASSFNSFGKRIVFKRTDENTTTPEYYTLVLNDAYFNTIGSELTAEYTFNNTAANAIALNSGDNKDVALLKTGSYFKINLTSASKMVIKSDVELNETYLIFDSEDPSSPQAMGSLIIKSQVTDDNGKVIYTYETNGTIQQGESIIGFASGNNTSAFANINVTFVPAN